jgi:hypothetical protein
MKLARYRPRGKIHRKGKLARSRQSLLVTAISSITAQAGSRSHSARWPEGSGLAFTSPTALPVGDSPDAVRVARKPAARIRIAAATKPRGPEPADLSQRQEGLDQQGKQKSATKEPRLETA